MLRFPDRGRLFLGVIHLRATPGAPRFDGDLAGLLEAAREDARALADGGAGAIVVENFGDAPFHKERVPPETVATMALACAEVRAVAGALPVGANVLRNDARAALGLAAACGLDFVRVNVHVGAAVTDQGIVEGRAAETLRERARLGREVAILADVHVKHATPLGSGSIGDAAREALGRGLADAVIVTGRATGAAPEETDLAAVRDAIGDARLLVGSGLDEASAVRLLEHADGAIVGTSLKDGSGRIDPARVRALAARFERGTA